METWWMPVSFMTLVGYHSRGVGALPNRRTGRLGWSAFHEIYTEQACPVVEGGFPVPPGLMMHAMRQFEPGRMAAEQHPRAERAMARPV